MREVVKIEDEETLDYVIEILTQLLIKQDFIDKQKNKTTYVKKVEVYKDLLKWFKKIRRDLDE